VIGIDTNVLVRYIAQDDPVQSKRANHLIEDECSAATPGFISLIVLLELVWVSTAIAYANIVNPTRKPFTVNEI